MKKYTWPSPEGLLIFIGSLLFLACSPDASTAEEPDLPFAADLLVVTERAQLREAPAPEARVIEELKRGDRLKDLGQVSEQTTRIQYGTRVFDEPWLQVRSRQGEIAWIYAREVAPLSPQIDVNVFRREKVLQAIFGRTGIQQIQAYQAAWESAASSRDLADTYKLGQRLRDSLTNPLEEYSYHFQQSTLPDLFWLKEYLPALVPQLVAEGNAYYLFHDYLQWRQRAQKTPEREDDRFFDLLLQAHPMDSIESFFPAWQIQTWDYGGYHLLGRGIVYDLLANINDFLPQAKSFGSAAEDLKNMIVADLSREHVDFWEPAPVVIQELDSIIQANWSIFTTADRVALTTRRQQLDNAAAAGIKFNARSGG